MTKLLKYLRGYKKETILAPLFKMLEASFELLVPLVMASLIDVGIKTENKSYIIRMCLILIGLAAIGLVCSITAQYYSAKAATGFATILRHELFDRIQHFSYSQLDKIGTATLITRMTSDINQLQSGVNLVLRLFLRSPFIVVGAMVMAFTVDVKAALIFAITIPILSIVVFGIMVITMPLYKKVQGLLDGLLLITRENLTGVRVIRAFNKEQEEKERFCEQNQILTNAQKYVGRISGLLNPVTYVIVNMALIILIYVGALRVNIGALTQGQVVALINYLSQILIELLKLADLIISVTKGVACGNRIQKVMEVIPDMKDGTRACEVFEEGKPVVEFCDVSLRYQGASAESLSHISFRAMKGQTIGIIGGTGSGKTSLINMIPRFYDAESGVVLVGGVDVREYRADELRKKIGIVPQKATLFKGTIAENLRWGNESATEEELEEAIRISQAKEFVDSKKGRLAFEIEQGGKNLSGGQKQRLTIARALVRKADILILDDSASALDFATDAKLRKAIREYRNNPVVFLVSQRASTIQYADEILVLDDGKIVGKGTHDVLLKECGVYQEIYYSQFPKEGDEHAQ